jgi:DNA-binding FadR family transcriptional regulator
LPLEAIEPRRLYRRIADQLRLLIDQGEFPVGSRLPAERELASQLGVSRPTVREALIALEVEGRLKIRVGSGIYVIEPQPAAAIANGASIEGPFEILRARRHARASQALA